MGNFFYNGHSSEEFGLSVSIETTTHSPRRDIIFESIPGRDGDIAISNDRFESLDWPIYCILKTENGDADFQATKISQWLNSNIKYQNLKLSWDKNYMYKAIFTEKYSIENLLPNFGKIPLNFKFHPYKYLNEGNEELKLNSNSILFNPEIFTSKPLIRIKGDGNITIKNNGKDWLILTSVDGEIIIDSESMTAYNNNGRQFNKMNATLRPLFPELAPGENLLTWTNTAFQVTIIPNWRRVI